MWPALQRLVWKRQEASSTRPLTVLCLLSEDYDRSLMTDLGRRQRWHLLFAATRQEAERGLHQLKPQIMLFDRDIAGQNWREFVTCFAAASRGMCIMLVSKVIDDNLWNELVSNGGYEVLRKPLREDEVSRAVKMAWTYWSSAAKRTATLKR
jgi:response regulator RpfG family c-di-GMP phosphodiesterase